MYNINVLYEYTGEAYCKNPVWVLVESADFCWNSMLHIDIIAPFAYISYGELFDFPAINIPAHALVRTQVTNQIGINLPYIKEELHKTQSNFAHHVLDITRLILRIADIEDTLEYIIDWRKQHEFAAR
ncbi:hypothetical protein ACFSTH_08065 [Paenibacillus yanchengensis]|uniref:Uncharacterized protein n=1 Tax=Paenibacillus yanchengensis TaxID=2035833 RepID=A0ABW4YLN4_9BACL